MNALNPMQNGHRFQQPKNTTDRADRKFWALRELEDILLLPGEIPDSHFVERGLVHDLNGDGIDINQICAIPERSAIVVICPDLPYLHIFVGQNLLHRAVLDLGNRIPLGISATPDEIVLEFANGEFGLVIISVLWLAAPALKNYEIPSEINRITFTTVGLRLAKIDAALAKPSGFVAFQSTSGKRRLLLWRNNPLELWAFDWTDEFFKCQKLNLNNPPGILEGVDMTSACFSSITSHIYFTDALGGRVFEVNPNALEPRLKVIAGDGNIKRRPQFGAAQDSRLSRMSSICEFHIEPADADILKEIILPIREAGDWFKSKPVSENKHPKKEIARTKLAELLTNVPFLVVVNQHNESSVSAISVSLPRSNHSTLSSLPESSRKVLPLAPFTKDSASAFWAASVTWEDGPRVVQSPSLGLIFYRSGQKKIGVLNSNYHSFCEGLQVLRDGKKNLASRMKNALDPIT